MAINQLIGNMTRTETSPLGSQARGSSSAATAASPASGSQVQTESVTLTQAARAARDPDSPFDAKRVATIRAAIADGSYTVDTKALAANMLGFASR